jgi:hypothetical protein
MLSTMFLLFRFFLFLLGKVPVPVRIVHVNRGFSLSLLRLFHFRVFLRRRTLNFYSVFLVAFPLLVLFRFLR